MWWWFADRVGGEVVLIAIAGAVLGVLFGFSAGTGGFCIRSAVHGLNDPVRRPQLVAWLAAVGFAVAATQLLISISVLDVSSARQASTAGSLSGAAVGGFLLGIGIGISRGCPSRQLVLAASGNLRSVVTIVFIAIAVDLSAYGTLAPLVERISSVWRLEARWRLASGAFDIPPLLLCGVGVAAIIGAIGLASATRTGQRTAVVGVIIGAVVSGAWTLTAVGAHEGFVVLYPSAISFAGPLGRLLLTVGHYEPNWASLDNFILAGTLVGAFAAGVRDQNLRMAAFADAQQLFARAAGGFLIGFGATAAGGCSMGLLSGVAILSLTSIVALGALGLGLAAQRYAEAAYTTAFGEPAAGPLAAQEWSRAESGQ